MRVVLAMSGGVDSSAAAYLLKQQGHDVIGLFMRSGAVEETACATNTESALPIVDARPHKQGCCSSADAADARRVADSLDIPFHALNFHEAFGRIKDYFVEEYLAGRTPNPCVVCNNWLKFGKLWEFAEQVGADRIATGHYAQIVRRDAAERPKLVRGRDISKDQSYVLFGINPQLLDRILFPVGSATKTEIRELARQAGIRVADKPDSQEICFIPDNDYAAFVERYADMPETSGEMVDTSGRVVGTHAGYEHFTIGQRKGLGVAFGSPRYVVAIDAEEKKVVIGEKADLARATLEADGLNWLIQDVPRSFRCQAKIRYRHEPADAEVDLLDDDTLQVTFAEAQFGVAPGQAVVLYNDDQVLGGGWIRSTR